MSYQKIIDVRNVFRRLPDLISVIKKIDVRNVFRRWPDSISIGDIFGCNFGYILDIFGFFGVGEVLERACIKRRGGYPFPSLDR